MKSTTATLDQGLERADWRTSSRSGNNGQCVQVAFLAAVNPTGEPEGDEATEDDTATE